MAERKKKPTLLDQWATESREETSRRTLRTAKEYSALKSEQWHSFFAHPEHMERAELLAEQIKSINEEDQ